MGRQPVIAAAAAAHGEPNIMWHLKAKVVANVAILVEQTLAAPHMQRELQWDIGDGADDALKH